MELNYRNRNYIVSEIILVLFYYCLFTQVTLLTGLELPKNIM